jgi:flagellar hook assembly protein FlgD
MATSITGVLTDANKAVLDKLDKDVKSNELKAKQQMGQDQFLHLITEQLKSQNPLEPIKDQQFIAQMAQLQALESSNSLVELSKASYLMNTDMSANLKAMNENIKLLVQKLVPTTTPGTTTPVTPPVASADAQTIVNELVKMNKAMEEYFKK